MSVSRFIFSVVVLLRLILTQPVHGRSCQDDSDCQDYEFCVSEQCGDLRLLCRNPAYCGDQATCVNRNHSAICICNPGFSGDLDRPCIVETECHTQHDCPGTLTCTSHRCKDMCKEMICGANAVCKTHNHFPTCECVAEYVRTYPNNITAGCQRCRVNADCPSNKVCLSSDCEDICTSDICGPNSQCTIQHHRVACECLAGYVRTDARNLSIGCSRESEQITTLSTTNNCPAGQCLAPYKDPCKDACGRNTVCSTHGGTAVCECEGEFAGYPYDKDLGCQWYVQDKGITLVERHYWVNNVMYVDSTVGEDTSILVRTSETGLQITSIQLKCVGRGDFNYTVSLEPVDKKQPVFITVRNVTSTADFVLVNLPVSRKDTGVLLRPNVQYRLTVSCDKQFPLYVHPNPEILRREMKFELAKAGEYYVSNIDSIGYTFLPRVGTHPTPTYRSISFNAEFVSPVSKGQKVSIRLKTRTFELEMMEVKCSGADVGEYKYTVSVESEADTDTVSYTGITYSVETHLAQQNVYIPISRPTRRVILRANTQYKLVVSCDREFHATVLTSPVEATDSLEFGLTNDGTHYLSPVRSIEYKQFTLG